MQHFYFNKSNRQKKKVVRHIPPFSVGLLWTFYSFVIMLICLILCDQAK